MPTKTFPLDPRLGATVELTGTTSADVLLAVTKGTPLPTRPNGVLELGGIGLALSSGKDLAITAGSTTMALGFGAVGHPAGAKGNPSLLPLPAGQESRTERQRRGAVGVGGHPTDNVRAGPGRDRHDRRWRLGLLELAHARHSPGPNPPALVRVRLAQQFVAIRQRLLDLNRHDQAGFFDGQWVSRWIDDANSDLGDQFLQHLCRFEALVIEKAVSAFENMQAFANANDRSPSTAIDRLAEFGADITTAFNQLAGQTVFSPPPLPAITQGVFLDATRAIATTSAVPTAMLTLNVLKPPAGRQFHIDSFVNGDIPGADDIAVEQRLVSLGD